MTATEFELIMSDDRVPAYIRKIANRAVIEIEEGNDNPIEVNENEFNLLVRYSGITPFKCSLTPFISIYDELENRKDIQLKNAWI